MSDDKKNYLDLDDEEEIPNFSDEDLIVIEPKPTIPIKENFDEDNIEEDSSEEFVEEFPDIEEVLDEELSEDISEEDLVEDIEDDFLTDDNPIEVEENVDFDLIYRLNTNKHRQEGKHTLQRDTIFKGKLEEKQITPEGSEYSGNDSTSHNDSFKLFDVEFDSYTDDYLNQNNLTKDVFNILEQKTNLDFRQNRRKPNKETFNNYYNLLLKELGFRYTKSEIFVELSYYFTDNIFNMFKLLDKRPATIIIKELMQKGYLKNINGIDFL
jgi:hypothetical protein